MKSGKQPHPPQWALTMFRWFCHEDYVEDIEGDLLERFESRIANKSLGQARWLFVLDVLQLYRSKLIRQTGGSYKLNNFGMIRSFFKTGWRNILKYRTNSIVSTFGLAAGLFATLLLYLIIDFEGSYDKFHHGSEYIYRVADRHPDGNYSTSIVTPVLPALLEEYPEIVHGTRFMEWQDAFLVNEKAYTFYFRLVDPGFPDVFSFTSLDGDLRQALSKPGQIVLTASLAKRVFGEERAIGKILTMKEMGYELKVSAVISDPPKNSSLQFESLMSWPASPNPLDESQMGNWYNTFMTAYVRLSPEADLASLESKTAEFTDKYYLPERKDDSITFLPLEGEHGRNTASDRTVFILGVVALATLLISCLNFVNLTVGQSFSRYRETGIRKVLGSHKQHLISQFLLEIGIKLMIAIGVALISVKLAAPYVNTYYNLLIQPASLIQWEVMACLMALCFTIGIVTSTMILMILTRPGLIRSLKETAYQGARGQWLQQGLICMQFAVAIVFVAGSWVIQQQIQFMKTSELNFDSSQVVSIDSYPEYFREPKEALSGLKRLKEQLPNETAIASVSLTQEVPGNYWENYNTFNNTDSTGITTINLKQITIDDQYFGLLGIEMVNGRNFNSQLITDSATVILNEAAWETIGWDDLDNKFLTAGGGEMTYRVIGVVKDYHYRSLKETIQPLIHFYHPDVSNKLLIKFEAGRVEDGLAILEDRWQSLNPYEPIEYAFLDQDFAALYQSYEKLAFTASFFSGLAVVLALLGLMSITLYTISTRRKEIGIRRVMGARVSRIILLLSKQFVHLVLAAFAIALPVIYYCSSEFLADFVYRIDQPYWIYMTTSAIVLVLAISLVSWQTGRVALESPVNSLRDE